MQTMKREESALDFLENLKDLHRTPLHHLPGYVAPVVTEEVTEEELDDLAEQHLQAVEAAKELSLADERHQLMVDPHNFVRSKIKQQVQDVVWLDLLRDQLQKDALQEEVEDRCVICTLPYGKCVHTMDAPHAPEAYVRADKKKDAVDRELEDMLGVMGAAVEVGTSAEDTEDIDMDTMRWIDQAPDRPDRIGATYLSLSTPPSRGWHSAVVLESVRLLVVFGGFRFKNREVPQPFAAAPKEGEVEYLSDLYRYDFVTKAWFGSNANQKRSREHPTGRYGHACATVGEDRMLVFGGKASHGRYLSDTWVYDVMNDSWALVQANSASPPPSPRNFSAMVTVDDRVFLFGGTDGVENFGDLWVFHVQQMRWERSIAVGIPPSPRYGHQMVMLHNPSVRESRLCIVGGCSVSPNSEVFGTALTPAESKRMLDLGLTLEASYLNEGEVAKVGGHHLQMASLETKKGIGELTLREIYKESGGVTGQLYESEMRTRQAEKDLVLAHNLMEASRSLKLQKAKHPNEKIDLFFLDVEDLMWKPQVYPAISGAFPPSRIHFGAISIGGYLIVCGGSKPTSLKNVCVDLDHTRMYALDLHQLVWTQPAPRESSEFLELPVSIAESDVLRAKVRVNLEKDRGKALGARNGMTLELSEAEAVLKVCEWRYTKLKHEMNNTTPPPAPRWGMTFVKNRSRGFMFSGWNKDKIVENQNLFVLDLEQEHERRRREDDEFQQKLETDRQNEEARNASANMQSAYELQQMIKAEKGNEAKERRKMVIEDVLSCVPPLTKPATPRLVMANQHSMWLTWDRITQNSVGNPLRTDEIKYNLYMINGYQHFTMEDRVLVMPQAAMDSIARENADDDDMSILTTESMKERNEHRAKEASLESSSRTKGTRGSKAKVKTDYSDYRGPGFPGEITGLHKTGFDVAYDDGSFEVNVHRSRMNLIKPRRRGDDIEEIDINLPEGMTLREFEQMKAEKQKRKDLLATLDMLNKEAYIIEDEMSIPCKKRIKRKFVVREMKKEKLQNFIARGSTIRPFNLTNEKLVAYSQRAAKPGSAAETRPTSKGSGETKTSATLTGADSDDESEEETEPQVTDEEAQLAKLNDLFENGYDRRQYLENLRSADSAGKEVTVSVHPNWELVYSGENNFAEVSSLVPREVLFYDKNLTVEVSFVLQICGCDFPSYETSELSEIVEFRTKRDQDGELADPHLTPLKPGTPRSLGGQSHGSKSNKTDSPLGTPPPVKKEKTYFSCLVRGKMVQFEIDGHTVSGLAQGDYYM